jgi:hypothetical protein
VSLSTAEYVGRTRNSVWERDLGQKLRSLPECERLEFLGEFALLNPVVAMDLARKTLQEKQSFMVLLERSIDEANASIIRYWLECVVPHLGPRKVLAYLRSQAPLKPEGVARARYWIPKFSQFPGYNQADLDALDDELAKYERIRSGEILPRKSPRRYV